MQFSKLCQDQLWFTPFRLQWDWKGPQILLLQLFKQNAVYGAENKENKGKMQKEKELTLGKSDHCERAYISLRKTAVLQPTAVQKSYCCHLLHAWNEQYSGNTTQLAFDICL